MAMSVSLSTKISNLDGCGVMHSFGPVKLCSMAIIIYGVERPIHG